MSGSRPVGSGTRRWAADAGCNERRIHPDRPGADRGSRRDKPRRSGPLRPSFFDSVTTNRLTFLSPIDTVCGMNNSPCDKPILVFLLRTYCRTVGSTTPTSGRSAFSGHLIRCAVCRCLRGAVRTVGCMPDPKWKQFEILVAKIQADLAGAGAVVTPGVLIVAHHNSL